MGCDGGTIPRRNELVKVKRKPEPRDQASHLIFQWRYCHITQEPLQRPIVACTLGKLYSKASVIEAVLNRDAPKHIRSLRDVVELKLTPNPEFVEGVMTQVESSPYICPVTGLEMSGRFRFVALWSCGCVFSERAFKEVATKTCPTCQTPFEDDDVLVLNAENAQKMRKRRKRAKAM